MSQKALVKKTSTVEVAWKDLRALLFWAGVGVSKSVGGGYGKNIEEIIRSYAKYIGFRGFSQPPHFKKSAEK